MITLSNIGWKSGLREWILQRLTGIYIAAYFIFIFIYLYLNNGFNYQNLQILFDTFYFKITTLLFVFNTILHLSIGMSIIITDYIKNTILRIVIDFIINLISLSYIFCIMQILWGLK